VVDIVVVELGLGDIGEIVVVVVLVAIAAAVGVVYSVEKWKQLR
jgi:hypothetical protein